VSDIKPLTDTPFESALARLIYAGEALGLALTLEQSLEDDRAAIKADAIQRIMKRDGIAATPAEKVVETDAAYFAHREKQRASVVARFRADAEYWAAKAQATQASLITPDVLTLEAENERLTLEVEGRAGEIEDVVNANHSLLSQRNRANSERNEARDLADGLKQKLDERDDTISLLNERAAEMQEQIADLQRVSNTLRAAGV